MAQVETAAHPFDDNERSALDALLTPHLVALHVILPIALGSIIYILWRPMTLRVFAWASDLHLRSLVIWAREATAPLLDKMPQWVLYNLPNGLWSYASVAAMIAIWGGKASLWSTGWIGLAWLVGVGSEFAQLLGWLSGTFGVGDVLAYSIGAAAAFFLLKVQRRGRCRH